MSIEIKLSKKPISYKKSMIFLNKRVDEVKNGDNSELIWILEHPKTYTAGVSFKENEIIDKKIRITETIMGTEKINKKKLINKKLKTVTRSIFYSKNIKRGEKISLKNIKSIRPGTGLSLSYFEKILGKRVKKNCKFANPVKLSDIVFN